MYEEQESTTKDKKGEDDDVDDDDDEDRRRTGCGSCGRKEIIRPRIMIQLTLREELTLLVNNLLLRLTMMRRELA